MKMRNLDPMMPRHQEHARDLARGDAKRMTKEKERLALVGRRGVIVNGTADDPEKIKTIKKHLEDLGYETKMLFVNTNNEVSRQRNIERGLNGGRKVPDGTNRDGVPDGSRDIRGEKWQSAQDAKHELKKVFGDEHFIHVDNSDDYRKVDDRKKREIDKQHTQIFKHIRQFVSTPSKSPAAQEWTKKEQEKRGIKKFSEPKVSNVSNKKAVRPYIPNASELEQAKRLGVQHLGDGHFGRDKNAEPTHTSKAGQLIMREDDGCWKKYHRIGVKKKNGKTVSNCAPIDESFENFIKENNDVSKREWGTTSLAQLYAQSTPGQENIIVQQDDGEIGYLTFDGIHKTVEKWINDTKTKARFVAKYGKEKAETKLMESAQKVNRLVPFMKESLDSKAGWDMGTVPKSLPENRQKINRKAMKAYRKKS
jgi:sulfur relay (sulfurtransferase) DsrC/TusE family protein